MYLSQWGEFPRICISICGVSRSYTVKEAASILANEIKNTTVDGVVVEANCTTRNLTEDEHLELQSVVVWKQTQISQEKANECT